MTRHFLPTLLLAGMFLSACDDGDGPGPGETGGTAGTGASPNLTCDEGDLLLWTETAGGAGGSGTLPRRVLTDEPSGLVQCRTGRINRAEALDCGAPLSFDQSNICDGFGYDYDEVCDTFDYDTWEEDGDDACETPGCIVRVGCATDDECGANEVCVCAAGRGNESSRSEQTISRCVPAGCKTNADCDSGECGASLGDCGYDIFGFECRTEKDECRDDADCPEGNDKCGYDDGLDRWTCGSYALCE